MKNERIGSPEQHLADRVASAASGVRLVQHTPGPWEFDGVDTVGSALANADVATLIAVRDTNYTHGGKWNTDAMEANGRLIAAAPDLYAALKEILAITDRNHVVWSAARAAICKVERNGVVE